MDTLNNIWESYTAGFSTIQKVIIAVVLAFIFCVGIMAFVMLLSEAFA